VSEVRERNKKQKKRDMDEERNPKITNKRGKVFKETKHNHTTNNNNHDQTQPTPSTTKQTNTNSVCV
jgi:hypothetical protein